MTRNEAIDRLRRVIFQVPHGQDIPQFGTGFFISRDGWALTARHVAKKIPANRPEIWLESRYLPIRQIVYLTIPSDVALLKLDPECAAGIDCLPVGHFMGRSSDLSPERWQLMRNEPVVIFGSASEVLRDTWQEARFDRETPVAKWQRPGEAAEHQFLLKAPSREQLLLGGLSGAPILSLNHGVIVGVETGVEGLHITGADLSDVWHGSDQERLRPSWTIIGLDPPPPERLAAPVPAVEEPPPVPGAETLPAPAYPDMAVQDVLEKNVDWMLTSPVIRLFVTEDDKHNPLEVLVLGEGMREIREELEMEAMAAALVLARNSQPLVHRGCIYLALDKEAAATCRLESPEEDLASALRKAEEQPSELLAILTRLRHSQTGASRPPPRLVDTLDVQAHPVLALRRFVGIAANLARRTGLLSVEHLSADDADALRLALANVVRDFARNRKQPVVLAPVGPAGRRAVFLEPVRRARAAVGAVRVCLPFDPSHQPELFQEAWKVCFERTFAPLREDFRRRLLLWQEEEKLDTEKVKYWEGLTDKQRQEHPPVETNYYIDDVWQIRVPSKGTSPALDYYRDTIPAALKTDVKNIKVYAAALEAYDQRIKDPDSTVRRIVLARMFDCALRARPFSDDRAVETVFARWRRAALPMLHAAWSRALREVGADPIELFQSANFICDANILPVERVLELQLRWVVDSAQSTVLFSEARGVAWVRDPVTEAVPAEAGPAGAPVLRDLARFLQSHATVGLDSRQVETLVNHWTALQRAVRYNNAGCAHTVRGIARATSHGRDIASLEVLRAIVACQNYGLPFLETLSRFVNQPPDSSGRLRLDGVPEDVAAHVINALRLDGRMVHALVGRTVMPWKPERPKEIVGRCLYQAVETARILDALAQVRDLLEPSGETQGTAFVKCAEAFELCLASATHAFPITSFFDHIWRRLSGASEQEGPLGLDDREKTAGPNGN